MPKWDKNTFIEKAKDSCYPHISNILIDLVNFADDSADTISWGRGKDCGTMVYKCKSDDFGVISLFHVTTSGQIKFLLNNMRHKIRKKEILKDFQLKLESNFMMDFNEDDYDTDIFYDIDSLFNTKSDVEKFISTINGISARLKQ